VFLWLPFALFSVEFLFVAIGFFEVSVVHLHIGIHRFFVFMFPFFSLSVSWVFLEIVKIIIVGLLFLSVFFLIGICLFLQFALLDIMVCYRFLEFIVFVLLLLQLLLIFLLRG
jgi:hypothetical protein